ncbi:MAG: tetratricopeptide repeat protein [Bryobacteraceae bacterium]|nr:tetratricopeptide repeat protein [Bryobacteraceae bacterium]
MSNLRLFPLTTIALTLFSAQLPEELPCPYAKQFALKLAGRSESGMSHVEIGVDGRRCAAVGHTLLAEDFFESGRLADAVRHLSAAIRLAEAEPANARLLFGALRIQVTVLVEGGMLSEARALIQRLRTVSFDLPEQNAVVQGLAGACYQAAGDHRAAEREYLQAIRAWDSIQRSKDSVTERSNLGVLYIALRRFEDAIELLQHALALLPSGKRTAYHRLVITNNLAVACREQGQTDLAVRYAREAVRLVEGARLGRFNQVAGVYSNSAQILRTAGHKREAKELELKARRVAAMAEAVVDFSELRDGGNTKP